MKIFWNGEKLVVDDEAGKVLKHSPGPGAIKWTEDADLNAMVYIKGPVGVVQEEILLSEVKDGAGANYTDAATFEASIVDFFVSAPDLGGFSAGAYIPSASTGEVVPAGVLTRAQIPLALTTSPPPDGFDMFETLQGPALRFVGDGSGKTRVFSMAISSGLKADFGASDRVVFSVSRRPYTQSAWDGADLIPGYAVSRKLPNKDLGAIALNSPFFTLQEGDLVEPSLLSVSGVTLLVDTFSLTIKQIG